MLLNSAPQRDDNADLNRTLHRHRTPVHAFYSLHTPFSRRCSLSPFGRYIKEKVEVKPLNRLRLYLYSSTTTLRSIYYLSPGCPQPIPPSPSTTPQVPLRPALANPPPNANTSSTQQRILPHPMLIAPSPMSGCTSTHGLAVRHPSPSAPPRSTGCYTTHHRVVYAVHVVHPPPRSCWPITRPEVVRQYAPSSTPPRPRYPPIAW